jgi:hypothetical protein
MNRTQIYCGREGYLTSTEFTRRTEEDVQRYAEAQPLKFKQAMAHFHRKDVRQIKTPAALAAGVAQHTK